MTGSGGSDDPFDWSNERLVQELCSPDRSWDAPPPKKWPDPVHLAGMLREHELDGRDLLTYEDLMGQAFESLCKDLEIKKIPHKTSLRMAIRLFQRRSLAYREWKKSQSHDEDDEPVSKKVQISAPQAVEPPNLLGLHDANSVEKSDTPRAMSTNGSEMPGRRSPSSLPRKEDTPIAAPNSADAANDQTSSALGGNPYHSPMHIDEPAAPSGYLPSATKKRKRLVPTNISSALTRRRPPGRPDHSSSRMPMTFANPFVESSGKPWQEGARGAYLGDWKLTREDLLQGPDPLESNKDSFKMNDFHWARQGPIPAGRRLQVHQIMRRFLRPRRHFVNLGRSRPNQTSTASRLADVDDKVLPALGESDDESYDTETWEEMELEEQERQNKQKQKRTHLPLDIVDATIADAIRAIETRWATKKLPKLRTQEYPLWMAARRSGSRRLKLDIARRESERYSQRINKLVEEMRQVEWKNEASIRRQVSILDANIDDRQHALWEIRLFSSAKAPQKLAVEGQGQPRGWSGARTVRTRLMGGDDEILTSSEDGSEDEDEDEDERYGHFNDFPVDDEDESDLMSEEGLSSADEEPFMRHRPVANMAVSEDGASSDTGRPSSDEPSSDEPSSDNESMKLPTGPAELPGTNQPHANTAATITKSTADPDSSPNTTQLLRDMLNDADRMQLSRFAWALNKDDHKVVWQIFCAPLLEQEHGQDKEQDSAPLIEGSQKVDATAFTRYFYSFAIGRNVGPDEFNLGDARIREKLLDNRGLFRSFCIQMQMMVFQIRRQKKTSEESAAGLPITTATTTATATATPTTNSAASATATATPTTNSAASVTATATATRKPKAKHSDDADDAYVTDDAEMQEVESDDQSVSMEESEDSVQNKPSASNKRRKRVITLDKEAQDLRANDIARRAAQETRRKALYESLEQSGTIAREKTRLIINTAKDNEHGFVYVNHWISRHIRDHQIEGVRFMWNQIIAPPDTRQGCLLAHTMGLGKTMQVITLLVAIAETANSPDSSISSQIPEDLRVSKTLILCPSGLVENWLDELLAWAQDSSLGKTYHVAATMGVDQRFHEVSTWAKDGGILVLGYPMFGRLLDDLGDEVGPLLRESPNIVIADEAHALKNPKSKIHRITSNFRTSARVAMTGSPLANSVDEYHSMINWVAPNYLADHREFVSVYANPIKEGFYRDSLPSQKRHAYKMLKILKDTVAPKIHRATVATLKDELPEKREFIIYLPLTELQLKVYSSFIDITQNQPMMEDINTTLQLWNFMLNLALLLAHPKVFQMRLNEMTKATGPRLSTFPPQTVQDLLATVSNRDIDNPVYSAKIVVLMGILDEAKRVNEKVLVFSQSKLVLDYLEAEFRRQKRRFSRLDGDTAINKRQAMVKEFNMGSDEVYLISTTAGGVGLNIQGANRVVIFDFRWNPMHEQQAIGRAYRIGQQKTVYVYWLIIGGSFETVLHDQAVFKTQLASRVVDKKNPSAWADQVRNYMAKPSIMAVDDELETRFRGRDPVLDALLADGSMAKQHICKIVSTDTFEQEEPEAKLTPEELNEAAKIVVMNKRRNRNSGRYVIDPAERMQLDGTDFPPFTVLSGPNAPPALIHPGAPNGLPSLPGTNLPPFTVQGGLNAPPTVNSPSAPNGSPSLAVPSPSTLSMPIMTNQAQVGLRPQTQQVQKEQQLKQAQQRQQAQKVQHVPKVLGGPVPTAMPAPPQLKQQPPLLPMSIPSQNPAGPVHFAPAFTDGSLLPEPEPEPEVQDASPPLFLAQPIVQPSPRPAARPPVAAAYSGSSLGTPEELEKVLVSQLVSGLLVHQRKPEPRVASLMAKKVVSSIQTHFKLSGLPARAQWGRLKNRAATDLVFVEAVVYGAISPAALATLTSAMENDFVRNVDVALAELDSLSAIGRFSRTDSRALGNSDSRTLFGTYEALRRVLDMKFFEIAANISPLNKGERRADAIDGLMDRIEEALEQSMLDLDPKLSSAFAAEYLARCARRAFRDSVFANALLTQGVDFFDSWATMDFEAEQRLVEELHRSAEARPSVQRSSSWGNSRVSSQGKSITKSTRPPKAESKDFSSVGLRNIPIRSPAARKAVGQASYETPQASGSRDVFGSASASSASASTSKTAARFKDPDHVRERLGKSQAQKHISRPDNAKGPASRDFLAMREVMDRRERKVVRSPAEAKAATTTTNATRPPAIRSVPRLDAKLQQQQHAAKHTKPQTPGTGNSANDPFVLD